MLSSFLKLLSHLRQKRFSPENHKRAIKICFCNRPGCTQWQEADSRFLTSLWVPYWPRQTKHSGSNILNQLPKTEWEHFQQSLFAGWCCFFPWLGYEAAFILMEKQISTSPKPLLLPWEDRHSSHKLYPTLSLEVSWGRPLLKILAVTTKMELWCSVFLNFILYSLAWDPLPRMAAKYRTEMSDLSATVSQMRLNSCLSVLQNGIKRFSFKSPMKDSSSREWLKLPEVWHFTRLWLGFEKRPRMFVSQKVFHNVQSYTWTHTKKAGTGRRLGLSSGFPSGWDFTVIFILSDFYAVIVLGLQMTN